MIDATFKHRVKGQDDFDLVIQAKKAVLHFDLNAKLVRVYFDDAEIQHYRHDADVVLINDHILEIPIPPDSTLRRREEDPGIHQPRAQGRAAQPASG